MVEAHIEIPLSVLAKRVRARAAACPGRYVLGIAGPPGAGKSTLSAALREALNAAADRPVAEIAPMDGFHLPNEVLRAAGSLARKGEPDTFDAAGFVAHLERLRHTPVGQRMLWPTFDRSIEEPVPGGVVFDSQPIVITEGNYLLLDGTLTDAESTAAWSGVRKLLDECWYLDATRESLEERLLHRHIRGGRTPEEAKVKVTDSDLRNADLVAPTSIHADLVLHERGGKYYTIAT
ncbi:nucleoside/nucleotide kinase family protein [Nocardia sp. NPDC052566]|uniref:nucleoside/nucleotide kinase family protein n=1 Tax=Nocardia sp. NPDC052566 TaxID=3364330 RepID=UPI0037CA6818